MKFFYLFLTFLISSFSNFAEKSHKSDRSELILLTKGIVGGISSPIVRQEIIFYRDESGKSQIWTSKLKEAPFKYTYYFARYDAAQFEELLQKLSQLKNLPLENPVAGEDIYEIDISLGVFSDQWQWMNQAPSGCVHMDSKTSPSRGQKRKFKEVVHLIENELEPLNLKETDKESFEKISQKARDCRKDYRVSRR